MVNTNVLQNLMTSSYKKRSETLDLVSAAPQGMLTLSLK
jgi:hypothetical protein